MGDAGALSFFPAKNLGAWGDAGAIVTSDDAIATRARSLREHGRATDPSRWATKDLFEEIGMNSRLDALQAAVLDVKARHLERGPSRVARSPPGTASSSPGWATSRSSANAPSTRHAYHQFVVRTPRRDALAEHLRDRGVATRSYYARPVHRLPAYASYEALDLRETDAASRELLALPIYPELTAGAQAPRRRRHSSAFSRV